MNSRLNAYNRPLEDYQKDYKDQDFTEGLSADEAERRLERDGLNKLEVEKTPKWKIFIRQFNNIIIYILLAAAILTLLMGYYTDSIIIALVIIINSLIGYYQEASAADSVESIRNMLQTVATVYRDDTRIDIPAEELVVGDVVFLEAGDAVPADMRLVQTDNLRISEASLTGEAEPIAKDSDVLLESKVALAEQANMAFASTNVTGGSGLGVVVATGADSQIGVISEQVQEAESADSPMMMEIDRIGKGLSVIIIFAAVLLFIFGLIQSSYSPQELLLAVLTMIVGSVPEGLPATTSVILAMGVSDMAKNKNTIVKRMPAVETLGSVDIIATDKTGTLTENEMTVTDVIIDDKHYTLTGVGYQPEGDLLLDGEPTELTEKMREFIQAGYFANDTTLEIIDGVWSINGEPTDGAFLTLYEKLTHDHIVEKAEEVDRLDFIPFDSDYRYMAALLEVDEEENVIYIKGSPDQLYPMARAYDPDFDEAYWDQVLDQLTQNGKRVVAVGMKRVPATTSELSHEELFEGINFLGLAGIIDPPRQEVISSIEEMKQAGVRVKMITGDHPATAQAIARQTRISSKPTAITGREWDELSLDAKRRVASSTDVFSRMTPTNKLEIVQAFQEDGHVTAMIGDGVNDAPALKQAEIGVSMGIEGTDVAKDAADMILTDDNFTTMSIAIEEGRRIYDNIKKSIIFLLPTSFAEGLIIAIALLMGREIPLNASQLLWINMVSAITIQFAFVFEPADPNIMKRQPRDNDKGMIGGWDAFEIFYISLLIALSGMAGYNYLIQVTGDAALASTAMVNIIVFSKIFYYFSMRTSQPALPRLFENKKGLLVILIMILLQLAFTYIPFMNSIFRTMPLGTNAWLVIILASLPSFVLNEFYKLFKRSLLKE